MIEKVKYVFKYKENRNYVHGTDLFNTVVDSLKEKGFEEILNIDMTFHKVAKNNMYGYLFDDQEKVDHSEYAFIFKFESNKKIYFIVLKDDNDCISERYSYQENDIIKLSVFNDHTKSISLNKKIQYSNIEKIVAMNKALLENLYKDVNGKWYFVRLQLKNDFNVAEYGLYHLNLVRNMKFQLTKTSIELDGIKVGNIYFSLVN